MMLLYDSLSSGKECFEPFKKGLARIFICGPTLYDFTHLGHARIFLTYDLLCRHLNERGYETDVLVNMTDINQNVFQKAREESLGCRAVAGFYAEKFAEDLDLLNIRSVTRLAYVSDYVDSMVRHISRLLDMKLAYVANGNVYLDSSIDRDYGMLSKQSQGQLLLHRLDIGPNKKSQNDIMLWNCSEEFDFAWESKFGRGVPWWHLQDTTVALENFGENYDIHGGARELLYPHHEAHLAQFKALSGSKAPVKVWMHVGLVLAGKEKMSKSLGNVVWSRDLVEKYGQNLVRLYIFSYHYRGDIGFAEPEIEAKRPLLERIRAAGMNASDRTDTDVSVLVSDFHAALDDDLDSPRAVAILDEICLKVREGARISVGDFEGACRVLGLRI